MVSACILADRNLSQGYLISKEPNLEFKMSWSYFSNNKNFSKWEWKKKWKILSSIRDSTQDYIGLREVIQKSKSKNSNKKIRILDFIFSLDQ